MKTQQKRHDYAPFLFRKSHNPFQTSIDDSPGACRYGRHLGKWDHRQFLVFLQIHMVNPQLAVIHIKIDKMFSKNRNFHHEPVAIQRYLTISVLCEASYLFALYISKPEHAPLRLAPSQNITDNLCNGNVVYLTKVFHFILSFTKPKI